MFIVFDGIDGSGKTTQAELCRDWLNNNGRKVILTHEPTNNVIGSLIKKNFLKGELDTPLIDAHLFSADRVLHCKEFIKPYLDKEYIVICDRYYYSTICYQANQGVSENWLIRMQKPALKPDIAIIIDREPSVSYDSVVKKKGEKNLTKFEKPFFLKSLRKKFIKIPSLLKKDNIKIVEGNNSIHEVHEEVKKILRKYL